MKKNNLDERQEQTLLKIEHNGCWFAFWGLLAAILIQTVFINADYKSVAGEWIVFMILCIYIAVACLKNGIWDRSLKPNTSTNFIVSLIAGILFGAFTAFKVYHDFPDKIMGCISAGVFSGVMVFALCFICLLLAAGALKKRQEKAGTGTGRLRSDVKRMTLWYFHKIILLLSNVGKSFQFVHP